jgi:YD repeat-containing protein
MSNANMAITIILNARVGSMGGRQDISGQYWTSPLGFIPLIGWGIGCPHTTLTEEINLWDYPGLTQAQIVDVFASTYYSPAQATTAFLVIPAGTATNPANLGRCKQCQDQAGSPVNVADGNVWIAERDYSAPGLGGGLELSRVWNSRLGFGLPAALAGMFGFGWRSTYEESITGPDANNNVQYWRGDGSAWTFTRNALLNTYSLSSPLDERAQLVRNPATGAFTLTLADGTQKIFSTLNVLAAVIDRNNNQTTLAYDSLNRLTSVTSPGGNTLTFNYHDPDTLQVEFVQDSVGLVAAYNYDNYSRLTNVSYPDGSALNFTYDPNSFMILSVTDSQGRLLESHTYDAQDRGLTSSRAYGVDQVTLSY